MCINSEANNGQQHQKWLFAVSELSTKRIGFISIFLLKAGVLNLTISKRKNLRLPLKVETDEVVFCLVLPVSFCQNLLHFTLGQWSESWRLWCQVSFSVVFLSFKNSSPREKVGKLSSFWDWWAKSLFVSFIVPKYNILPGANNGYSCEKKFSGYAICSRHQPESALSRLGAHLRILNLIAWLC